MEEGKQLEPKDYFLAFPCSPGQLVRRDLSKYNVLKTKKKITKNAHIMVDDVEQTNTSVELEGILKEIADLLAESNVVVPAGSECEVSHHYGIEKFHETGVAMNDCVNREYCKKILIMLIFIRMILSLSQ